MTSPLIVPAEVKQMAPDVIADTVHELENLDKADALALIGTLNDGAAFNFFKLGGVLARIRSHRWYDPYETLAEFCETEHGIRPRKAQRLMLIYNSLVEAKIPWDQVKHLGWTKLSIIATLLKQENGQQWIKIAEEQKTIQLIDTVKKAMKGAAGEVQSIEDQSAKISTKTFKLHDDQRQTIEAAIDKAKEQAGTQYDSAALELICLDFLGGGGSKMPSPKDFLQSIGLDAAAKALEDAFPNVDIQLQLSDAA
jgi:hypothetical protein